MKKLLFILGLLISVCSVAQIDEVVPKKKTPPKLVNDYTNTLTPSQAQALEKKLVAYDDTTSNQIAVVIIPTTGNYSVEEVALEILRTWGVGNKDINNGLVLLIAKNDRKMRIEVGYGLEGAVTDVDSKDIIENVLKPNFRANNFYAGIDEATDALIQEAAGEYKAPQNYGSSKKAKGKGISTIVIIIIILVIIFAGSAPGGGTYVSRGGFSGWTGGGGRSGWSGGGGGFGGFGGGSGGGGGASGSW